MTIYRSRGLRGLGTGIVLCVSLLALGCGKHTYDVFSYKDTNENNLYDSALKETHEVRTDSETVAKGVVKIGEETLIMSREMTRKEIENIPLENRDKIFSE